MVVGSNDPRVCPRGVEEGDQSVAHDLQHFSEGTAEGANILNPTLVQHEHVFPEIVVFQRLGRASPCWHAVSYSDVVSLVALTVLAINQKGSYP
jgi:hypothetical protein